MKSNEIRAKFLEFFNEKRHLIVPSAPIVVKNDPTLMFNNAGMNQFKDVFLGNSQPKSARVADTQKCLRVSGKHNDLEEVGVDTYHHTMFEMLGNWSFGDYFKPEAIAWAWELLTEVYGIDKERIYVSVFEGDVKDGLDKDEEAINEWKKWIAEDRILAFDKKDNFWEMGEVGPCGPCSEIHVDMRPEAERAKIDGKSLVNADHPQVVEIWNLVFIQYQRMANGSLVELPAKHIDTGMGFERLCMALQGKQSNYDTDVFTPLLSKIEELTNVEYTAGDSEKDVAFRVIADHIRAISFTIADGQLPSNTGAGYVIRRILRRAVRYAYTHLNSKQPLLYQLVAILVKEMGHVFPEIKEQQAHIEATVKGEEEAFLRTLGSGIQRFGQLKQEMTKNNKTQVEGAKAFELYDTYGFPFDLTMLMAKECGFTVDEAGFEAEMKKQKERARAATSLETDDWVELKADGKTEFIGYTHLESETAVVKYRKVNIKKKNFYQLVLEQTPFYAESGGQVGDKGLLWFGEEKIPVIDTKKENDLILHFTTVLPADITQMVKATVNAGKRKATERNHTATHLLHSSLKQVLGTHVAQKGSEVTPDKLRFDFSHTAKVSDEQIAEVESIVNAKIRENIKGEIETMSFDAAQSKGATALFGEKYGDEVRVVTFDPDYSMELCGGTHVNATGEIGFCKLTVETSVGTGIRRVEALTGEKAFDYLAKETSTLRDIKTMFKNPKNILGSIQQLVDKQTALEQEIQQLHAQQASQVKDVLLTKIETINGVNAIIQSIDAPSADAIKKIAYDLRNEVESLYCVLAANLNGKVNLTIMIDDAVVESKGLNAGQLIRQVAKHIQGGGGGQAFFATAGGKNPNGIQAALDEARGVLG